MTTVGDSVNTRCDTRFEADTFFNFPDDYDDQYLQHMHNAHTPERVKDIGDAQERALGRMSEEVNNDAAAIQTDLENSGCQFDEQMVRRKSVLINTMGKFKSRYPEKMSLAEYMLHSYVILHTKDPNTILTYEIITNHTNIDPDQFIRVLATQTLSRFEQEQFELDPSGILKMNSKDDKEMEQMDKHFTRLFQLCCTEVEENEEAATDFGSATSYGTLEDTPQSSSNSDVAPQTENSGNLNFADIMHVSELSNDVVYEALRLHGNRLVQRSVYGTAKKLCSNSSQEAAAKANATSADLKGFVDNIQKYSVDSKQESDYYGEERRMSARQSALMRKKLM